MKTLIVSMLRVGDLFQHLRMVQMFSHQKNLGEIHWLIDESSSGATEILNGRIHIFPRSTIQKIILERTAHPQRCVKLVKDLISAVNAEKYDLVLNLTHTRVSHRFLDLIQASEVRGGRSDLSSNADFQALNAIAGSDGNPPDIYAKLLTAGLGFEWNLAQPVTESFSRRGIALHALSYDEKKNWSLENWQVILKSLRLQYPQELLYLLGSPAQAQLLKPLVVPGVELFCKGFSETQKLLANVRALIGIDSSLAHLAATVGTPSYLLYLGSANEKKIVPLQQGSAVLPATSPCFPCKHNSSCSQASHVCGESLAPSVVDAFLKQCLSAGSEVPAVSLGNLFTRL